ncbi:MAG: glycosyltransferase, partial [Armatimonadetes bacterium]|nr:glycosyltransferase [Armatimonadota bacterium]
MSPIRLLHVLEATVGGTRRHLLDLCLGLPPERFQQHIVCATLRDERFGEDIKALRQAGVEVTDLPMRREISAPSDWRCLRQLRDVIAQWQPQVVHGHSSKGGFLARLAVRGLKPRPKVVFNPHGFAFQMRTSALKRNMYVALERYAARWTDALVAGCESQKQLALTHGLLPAERIAIIPNGVRVADFEAAGDRGAVRAALGLPVAARVAGTVAALVSQKGVEYLVRAAAAV